MYTCIPGIQAQQLRKLVFSKTGPYLLLCSKIYPEQKSKEWAKLIYKHVHSWKSYLGLQSIRNKLNVQQQGLHRVKLWLSLLWSIRWPLTILL